MPTTIQIIIISAEAAMWYNTMIGEKLTVKEPKNPILKPMYYEYKGQQIVFKTDCKTI